MKLPNIFEREVTPQSFSAGSVIFREGEHGDSLFVVKSGEVDIYIHDHLVETVGADGFFGEVALLDHVTLRRDGRRKDGLYAGPDKRAAFSVYGRRDAFFCVGGSPSDVLAASPAKRDHLGLIFWSFAAPSGKRRIDAFGTCPSASLNA